MVKEEIKEGWYLMCNYRRGMFSCERLVEFFALDACEQFDFIPEKHIGGVLGYVGNMLKIDERGRFSHLEKTDIEGEGLIRCTSIENYKAGKVYVAISNQHGNRVSRFIVPKDSVQYIPTALIN